MPSYSLIRPFTDSHYRWPETCRVINKLRPIVLLYMASGSQTILIDATEEALTIRYILKAGVCHASSFLIVYRTNACIFPSISGRAAVTRPIVLRRLALADTDQVFFLNREMYHYPTSNS